jgi:hypothetical protein
MVPLQTESVENDANALVDFVNGAIDGGESALLETLREGVVFLASDIPNAFSRSCLARPRRPV